MSSPADLLTASTFFRAFVDNLPPVEDLLAAWQSATAYTSLFLDESGSNGGPGFLRRVAGSLGLNFVEQEYFRIDAVFFNERWDGEFLGPNWAKRILVAFEHENDWRSSAQEMSKLALLDVPLKVLVTFSRSDDEATELLDQFDKIIRAAMSGPQAQSLIIFGQKQLKERSVTWSGWEWQDGWRSM